MLLEQRGALLHLDAGGRPGLGDSPQHLLPADHHADDPGDWHHCIGTLQTLHRPAAAAHAGDAGIVIIALQSRGLAA